MERRKNLIMIALFLALIGLPYLLWPVAEQYVDTTSAENRTMAEFPVFTWGRAAAFPTEFESYVNDHLPFRNQLIQANSLMLYRLGEADSGGGWLAVS